MQYKHFRPWFLCLLFSYCIVPGRAQSFTFNCTRDTVVPRCTPTSCFTLLATIPDIRSSTSSYTVSSIGETPTACFPVYVQPNDPAGTSANMTVDDRYSNVVNIPFTFPFYAALNNALVISPNGLVSFDVTLAGQTAHHRIHRNASGQLAPTGTPENLPSSLYDRALIMGPYHDMNPGETTSPSMRIQYQTIGVAPHRKWILSYYKQPLYSNTGGCNLMIENTQQIVLYESTGIIEVLVFSKQPCVNWNDGKAILGIQSFDRTQALMVAGHTASDPPWGSINMQEAYRFVPATGASLLKRVELTDLSGNIVATGTTVPAGNGKLEVSFPNLCPVIGSTVTYIVRPVYSKFDNLAVEIFGSDTVVVTKSANTDLHATSVSTNTDCYTPTGTITVTVPAGTAVPPYVYKLDNNPVISGGSPFTFTNVTNGAHTVVITDPTGTCLSTLNVQVERDNSLLLTKTSTPTACVDVSTGSVTVTATNGVAPYFFQLDGFPWVLSNSPTYTFTNVSAGPHQVQAIDAVSCQSVRSTITVNAGPGPGATITGATPSSCSAIANGSLTVSASGGVAPFQWQLDSGPLQSGSNPFTFNAVSAGTHTITIIDAIGCTKTMAAGVGAGPGVDGTTAFTAASCQGIDNGTITVQATAGLSPFTFQVDAGPFVSGAAPNSITFSNISGGIHTITIKDRVGCTKSFSVTVTTGPPLTAGTSATATSCNGASNGSIMLTPTSGTGPYTFSIDNGPFVPGTVPHIFTGLSSGLHTVKYRDAPGCISNNFSVTVPPGPTITATVTKTNALCNQTATGSITVSQPSLGTAPFEYSLDNINWQTGNQFTSIPAGTYTVYYRSANGCTGSQSVTISEPQQLTSTASIVRVVCHGENNGVITMNTIGGTAPYQYSIDGGLNWQNLNIFQAAAGTYVIRTRDANNCIVNKQVIMTEPAILTGSSLNTNASCDGGSDGRINVNASGGNGNYRYSIDGLNYQAAPLFLVDPGTYTILVRDDLGCSTSFTTTVGLSVNLFLTPLPDLSICSGQSIQFSAISNGASYNWSPSTGLSSTTIPNPTANPADTTTYILITTLGRCTTTDTMVLNVNKAPIPNAGPDGDICYGQSYTLQGSGGFQYNWSPPLYLNTTTGANPVATPTRTTVYQLSVTDAIGCRSTFADEVKVVTSRPMRVNTYPFDTVAYPGANIHLLATSAGVRYSWSPTTGLNNPNVADPVVTVGNIGEEITYQVVAVTEEGCKGEGYVKIRVSKGPDVYVATAFTPNNDGKNDLFTPFPVGIKSYKYFRVFNRWGQLMFTTNKLHEGWNGNLDGKPQPTGAYVWMIEALTIDNKPILKKGTVTLIR